MVLGGKTLKPTTDGKQSSPGKISKVYADKMTIGDSTFRVAKTKPLGSALRTNLSIFYFSCLTASRFSLILKAMKYLIILILLASLASIVYGFSIQEEQLALANKYIGFGTVGLFLVAMPLFLINYSRGKKMKDYMLNEENILKMRGKEKEKDGKK